MTHLLNLSNDMADIVAGAGAGVVRVTGRRRMAASGIVWTADGLIVTADHVVPKRHQPKIGLPDGSVVPATIVGRDPTTDIAILQAETSGLTVAPRGTAADLRVGQLAVALARPRNSVQATLGMVSATAGEWRTHMGGRMAHFIRTDVLMYPGFSGGPLINGAGELVGMNSSALQRGESLTISNATIERVAEALATHGRVRRGYLGVKTQTVRLPDAVTETLSQESGVLLIDVVAGGPAAESGLIVGDIIVTFGEKRTAESDDLISVLSAADVTEKSPVQIVRGGVLQDVTVKVGEKRAK